MSSVQSALVERDEPGDFSPRDRDDDVWRPSPAPDDRLSDDVGTGSVEGNGDETPTSPDWWAYLADDIDDDEDDGPDPLASTAPLPLPPEDRLWRHPSEIRGLLTDEVVTPASSPSGASRSLAGAVVLSTIVALTLSPVMCSLLLRVKLLHTLSGSSGMSIPSTSDSNSR